MSLLQEDFNNYDAIVSLKKKILKIAPFNIYKNGSHTAGRFLYNLNDEDFSLNIKNSKLSLSDLYYFRQFDLGIKSDFAFDLNINKKQGIKLRSSLFNSSVRDISLGDSKINLEIKDDEKKLDANLFNDEVILQSGISLKKPGKPFTFNSEINIANLSKALGVLSLKNLESGNLSGAISLDVEASGELENVNKTNLDMELKQLSLRRNDASISLKYPFNKLQIRRGKILKDKIVLGGNGQHITLGAK